jgi:hypothetical protein
MGTFSAAITWASPFGSMRGHSGCVGGAFGLVDLGVTHY